MDECSMVSLINDEGIVFLVHIFFECKAYSSLRPISRSRVLLEIHSSEFSTIEDSLVKHQ